MKNSPIGRVPADVEVSAWLAEPPPDEVKRALQRIARAPDVRAIAVMPDVHLAENVCVGTVLATEELVYPQAVGGDIGCGMAAVRIAASAERMAEPAIAHRILADLREAVPILRHRSLGESPALPDVLSQSGLSDCAFANSLRRDATIEFGTLGRGNHFLELQVDEDGAVWLMVHSGSRWVGQAIARRYLSLADTAGGGLRCLSASSESGAAYLHDAAWATRYADLSRRWMLRRAIHVVMRHAASSARKSDGFNGRCDAKSEVGDSVGDFDNSVISCDHNHVRRESIDGRELWLHRKGANAAGIDQPGIIAGSMGSMSVLTTGRGVSAALYSSSHGAGRAMSRQEARRRISPQALHAQLRDLTIDPAMVSSFVEEAPQAYKDIRAVLRAQRDLIRIEHRLRTILTYKGL